MMYRILYGSDLHGSNAYFRKFIAAAMQYKANALMVGGDVTGKAMSPIIHQGGGRYIGHLFGRKEEITTTQELEKFKVTVGNVGFYPIVLEKDEAEAMEKDPKMLNKRFEQEMVGRVGEWMALFEEKLAPQKLTMYFMPGNDDLFSIDAEIAMYPHVKNPDMTCIKLDSGNELVGLSYCNMTPWACERDIEEPQMEEKLNKLAGMMEKPETAIAMLHCPPHDSGIDVCPELDKNIKIVTTGGQVIMKPAGSTAVRGFIEKVQPMLGLHGHIHEAPGHTHIGRTLCINAGSEYAEGIMKAAIINIEGDKVKGHLLISG